MLKKIFIGLVVLILLTFSTAYIFLFTSFGNGFISKMVQDSVNAKAPIDFKIEEFELTMSTLKLKSSIDTTSIVDIKGTISPFKLAFDLSYLIDIKELSKLEKFTKQKFQGSFKTNGKIKGNKGLFLVNGVTDLFKSSSKYDVILKNFEVTNIDILFKNINIAEILYTLNQPVYASGMVDIKANVTNISLEKLSGDILTTIHSGKLNNPIVNEKFGLKLQGDKLFDGVVTTLLKPMLIDNKANLNTSFANIEVQSAKVDLQNTYITSDYKVAVSDLNNLFDFTQMPLKGSIEVDGEFKKEKNLELNGASNTLGGAVDFKLYNDDFNANLKDIKALEITKMLIYPDFFSSNINGVMDYNIKSEQGTIKANLSNGYFTKNRFTELVDKIIKGEISGSVYDDFELNSQIDKKIIQTQVSLKDNKSSIEVPNSTINLENKTVDAIANIKYEQYELGAVINGDIQKPQIKLDTSKIVKQIVNDRLEKEIQKIKEKDENVGNVIDSLKSIFGK